ncbi:cation-translocating P-type ATPase, partial [Chloroflexota bacterium]
DTLMDMWVIIGVVLATAIIGFLQEGKAESSLEALKKMMVPQCTVLRGGQEKTIPTREVVPGDIIILEDGDRIPADLRLFSVKGLSVDEATLTGESIPVQKHVDALENPNLSPGDQVNMCFSGTFVTRGRGRGLVVTTGEQTLLGQIAHIMQQTKKIDPPIMRKMATFTKLIIIVCVLFGVVNFILGTFLGYEWSYMLLATAGVIVAMIPEGLAGAIIAAFAVGAIAMSRRNVLIKRLPAAETLGCTTVICSDKTGTLTKNEMTVIRVYSGGKDYRVSGVGYEPHGEFVFEDAVIKKVQEDHKCLTETLKAGMHCSNCVLEKGDYGYSIRGDPTEGALVVCAAKAGLENNLPRLDEIPFNSELTYMGTIHKIEGKHVIYVKGSPEKIMAMCQNQLVDGGLEPFNREETLSKVYEMAREALRVIGVAYKYVDTEHESLDTEHLHNMTFLGLQGMIDPPRQEAIEAVKTCKSAGIRVVMITGDHVETAKAVAGQLGIAGAEGKVLSGEEIQKMSDEELRKVVKKVSVYARVAPEHKYRIVDLLQKHGEIVAVTGDGVNDAPALKRADIGIAMGITGTEVSKEASDMVLADDNFASIIAAVEEGRHVFTNIWKVILYLLPTNGGQGLVMIGAVLLSPLVPAFALRLPIEPVQILWVNLIIAIGCSISLIWEPKEKGILSRPPRDPKEKLFNPVFIQKVLIVSVISALAVFGLFLAYINVSGMSEEHLSQAQTVAFTTLIMVQLCYLFTARSMTESAFRFSPFSNKYVLIGAGATLVLQIFIIYSSTLFGISPFRTTPFPVIWWLPIILVSMVSFFAIELEKVIRKRFMRIAKGTS